MLKQFASLATAGVIALNGIPKAHAESNNTDIIRMHLEDYYHSQVLEHIQLPHKALQGIGRMQFLGSSLRIRPATQQGFRITNLEEENTATTRPRPITNEEEEALPARAGVYRRGRLSMQEVEIHEEESTSNFRHALRELEEAPGNTPPLRMVVVDREGVPHEVFDFEAYIKQHIFNQTSQHFRQNMTGHKHTRANSMSFGIGQQHGVELHMNQFHAAFNAHTLAQNTTNFGKFGFSFEGLQLGDISLSVPEAYLGFMTDSKEDGLEKHSYITLDASLTAEYPIPFQIPNHEFRVAANIAPLSMGYLGSHFEEKETEEEALSIAQAPESAGGGAFDIPMQAGIFHHTALGPLQFNNWVLGKTAPYFGSNARFLHQIEAGSQLSMDFGHHIIGTASQSIGTSDLELSFNTGLSLYEEHGDFHVSGNLMYIAPHAHASRTLGNINIRDYWMLEGIFSKRIDNIVYGAHLLCNEDFAGLSLVINMPFTETHDLTKPSHAKEEAHPSEVAPEHTPKQHVALPFFLQKAKSVLNNNITNIASVTGQKVS